MKKIYSLLTISLIAFLGISDVSAQVSIINGSTTVCQDSLYDSGGPTGSYSASETLEYTISPTNASTVTITVDSIDIEAGDILRIHDGPTSAAALLYEFNDTTVFIPGPITTSTGDVTILFTSDATTEDFGFKLHWEGNLPQATVSFTKDITNICNGNNVTFTATPVNGGTSPDYQWYVNGSPDGANSNIYTNNTLSDNDYVKVMLDADGEGCAGDTIAYDSLQVTVTDYDTAFVTITAGPDSICNGDNVMYTATPTNGGVSPDYQWFINSTPQTTGSTFSTAALIDGDYVKVELDGHVDGGCQIDSIARDSIQVTVTTYVTASVAVSTAAINICEGDSITFTAAPTNGGSPNYQWYLNGTPEGSNSDTYKGGNLANNDNVKVRMAANGNNGCVNDSLSYDSLIVTVNVNDTASVYISGSLVNNQCEGDNVTFTANPTNGGASPVYDWSINGGFVANGVSIATDTLSTGALVSVQMTSDYYTIGCLIDSISSDDTTLTVLPNDTASVSITVSDSSVCAGTSVMFTATPTNGGSPTYKWTIDGGGTVSTSNTFSSSSLIDGNDVECEMESSIGTGCLIDSVSTDNVVMTIYDNPSVSIGSPTDVQCYGDSTGGGTANVSGGTGPFTYSWTSGESTQTASMLWAATHQVNVVDNNLCVDSNTVVISENPEITFAFTVTDATPFGASNGAVSVIVSGGVPNYDHDWSNGVSTNNNSSSSISGVAAGTYTDTVYDNNGTGNVCKVWASAVVNQPGVLLGGTISIDNTTTKAICAGDNVGLMDNEADALGGIGFLSYQWQYSYNLLSWTNYVDDTLNTMTLNDSITQITFVRRIAVDDADDTVSSNILFLNYIADVAINIIGLDPAYCQSDPAEVLIGTPTGAGGSFIPSTYLTAGGTFSPALAASSPVGASNNVGYTYSDTYGCISSAVTSTSVSDTTTGQAQIPQVVFSTTDSLVQLYDTLYTQADPGGSGLWTGEGIIFAAGKWYFDPTLISFAGSDTIIDLSYSFTNSNGCTSHENFTIQITFNLIEIVIESNISQPSSCSNLPSDRLLAIIPNGETVTQSFWYIYSETYNSLIYNYTPDNTPTIDTVFYPFDPARFVPVYPYSGTWDTTAVTPVGVTKLHVRFYHRTVSNPNLSFIEFDMELVNLGSATITSNQINSNGTSAANYFHHCVSVDSNELYTTFTNLGARAVDWKIEPTSGPGSVLKDNGDGTAVLYPPNTVRFYDVYSPSIDWDTIGFVYTDVQSGCSIRTEKRFYPTVKPPVSVTPLTNEYCSNDGSITLQGTLFSPTRGVFTSSNDVALNFNTNPNFDTASFVAGPMAIGTGNWIQYKYTDTYGCSDSVQEVFDVLAIPQIQLVSESGDEFCESDQVLHTMRGEVWNGSIWQSGSGITGSVYGDGIVDSTVSASLGTFRADSAGDGIRTIKYKHTENATGCYNIVDTTVTVHALPNSSFTTSDSAMCMTESDWAWFTYTGGDVGTYTYYLAGYPGAITDFDPVDNPNIGFGLNKVYNIFTETATTCENTDTIHIYVDTFPIVDVTSAAGAYCYNGGVFNFAGSPASPGGLIPSYFNSPSLSYSDTLFSTGDSVRSFLPDVGDIGVNKMYYNYTDPITGCFAKDSMDIEIYDIPTLSLQILSNPGALQLLHCIGDTVEYEKIKNGGTDISALSYIIGPGFVDSTQNFFNSDVAGVGSHLVTYKSLDSNNCYNETDTIIDVIGTSDPSFAMSSNTECIDPNTMVVLQPNASPANNGGTFKFPDLDPSYDIANVSTDTFFLGWLSDADTTYTIRYVYDAGFGCIDSLDQIITVNDTPNVSFTAFPAEYCANDGTVGIKVDEASLGGSYYRSYYYPGYQDFNGLIDSNAIANGVDSVQFTLDTSYANEQIYVDYIHVDANGCEGIVWDQFYVNLVPELDVYYDTNVCATTDTLSLFGEALDGTSPYAGGWFTGSIYGQSNGLVNTDTSSNGEYGAFPNNTFFTDTVYFNYIDPVTNCFNKVSRLVEVKQLPPPFFTIDPSSHPSTTNICPDEKSTTTSEYDQGINPSLWPDVTRWWDINDYTIADVDGEFNPGPAGIDDSSNYDGWNRITHSINDNRYGCYDTYTDSVYLDSFPVVDIRYDSSLYCTNSGPIIFTGWPASPGFSPPYTLPSKFTNSGNINTGFDSLNTITLINSGDSTISIVMDSIKNTHLPGIGAIKIKDLSYTYMEPATGCVSTKTETFKLKRAPVLGLQAIEKVFCPYNADEVISLFVNTAPAGAQGSDSITGLGLVHPISAGGQINYAPVKFKGDLYPTHDTIIYTHVDSNYCESVLIDTAFRVKNQPDFTIIIPPKKDKVCLEEPAVTLGIDYYDLVSLSNQDYGNLQGNSPPANIDQSYFSYEQILPNSGPQSRDFVAEFDSKGKTDGVTTEVRFIGSYKGNHCYDTSITQIITYPKPIASFYIDGRCGKYRTVMHGDSSTLDTTGGFFGDAINRYEWTVDGFDSAYTKQNDTLVTLQWYGEFGDDKIDIDLTAVSTKGCRSDEVTKEIQFLTTPDAEFTWSMGDECIGDSVEFRPSLDIALDTSTVDFIWDFGDGGTSLLKEKVPHEFTSVDTFTVVLVLNEGAGSACLDTAIHDIFIRPVISSFPDMDDFEDAYSGWVIWNEDTSAVAGQFEHGVVDKNFLSDSVNNSWATGLTQIYANNLKTSVTSPCFDLSSIERPMVKMKTRFLTNENDGAILQYTTDQTSELKDIQWENVGDYFVENGTTKHRRTGINWYTKNGIFGAPGGNQSNPKRFGWSQEDSLTSTLITWNESRHNIDELIGEDYVRFRVNFATDPSIRGEGFAFDDFEITERKRKVLYETFTNSSAGGVIEDLMADYNPEVDKAVLDVVDVQYHTAFPSGDPMNQHNTADPSSRALLYSISEVPTVQMSGNKFSGLVSSKDFGEWTYKPLALTDPKYKIDMAYNENTKSVSVDVTAIGPSTSYPQNIAIHVAMLETYIDADNFNDSVGGNDEFRNVLKRMYPSAGGTQVSAGFAGWSTNVTETVNFDNFFADSMYRIVAFVQDLNTREVYQVEWVDGGKLGTDVLEYEDLVYEGVEYNLYPNPTDGTAYMEFKNELGNTYELRVFNQLGAQVKQDIVPGGTRMHRLDMHDMDVGMYFIMLNDGEHKVAIKKLMISR